MSFNGCLVSATCFRELVSKSPASAYMRTRVLEIGEGLVKDGKIDIYALGLAMGRFSNTLDDADTADFLLAIADTSNINKLPFVSVSGVPVS